MLGEQLSHKREHRSSEILQGDFVTCLARLLQRSVPSDKAALVATSTVKIRLGGWEVAEQPRSLALSSVYDTACTSERLLCTLEATTEYRSSIRLLNWCGAFVHVIFHGKVSDPWIELTSFHCNIPDLLFFYWLCLYSSQISKRRNAQPVFPLWSTWEKKWKNLVNPKPRQHKLVSAKGEKKNKKAVMFWR